MSMTDEIIDHRSQVLDGFWLPKKIRKLVLKPDTKYAYSSFKDGKPSNPEISGAITTRWPELNHDEWLELINLLSESRNLSPQGKEFWVRMEDALKKVGEMFSVQQYLFDSHMLDSISSYTGFSVPMLQVMVRALNLVSLDKLPQAYNQSINYILGGEWRPLKDLNGRILFTHQNRLQYFLKRFSSTMFARKVSEPLPTRIVLGYGAGNVPGTALLIALLAQSTTITGSPPPVILVKNSRREPIFSPLILSGIEQVDPALVAGTGVLIWDYENLGLQEELLTRSDLVIVAAGDDTISKLDNQITSINSKIRPKPKIRFHQHGHKVSFSAIDRGTLQKGMLDPTLKTPLLDMVTLLAGLDSIYWDQYGCLSSRIHFIENGSEKDYTAEEYGEKLVHQLRKLSSILPRGSAPLSLLRDNFDRYKILERFNQVKIFSDYQDDFLVVLDRRSLDQQAFFSAVNSCMGRVIIIRSIKNLMDIPQKYLKLLPAKNLQSLSVAFAPEYDIEDPKYHDFLYAAARCGITAIRSLGRGAFPQLSYSWDGLIPLDLVAERPAGYFSTIEFENPYQEMIETYKRFTMIN